VSAPSHAARDGAAHPTVDPDQLEIAPGTARQSVEGWVPALATEEETRAALEQAFDYRGDVTITRKDGVKLEGYLFDRVTAPDLASSFVRLLPKDSNQRVRISYADIAALAFSGRDPAAGKSWDAWVSKYWAKKTAGEGDISIRPEALE
jgi:hypothetical protein